MSRKDKKEIDPEELMRKKFKAKCQFRALGRLVMANTYWLIEGIDHYEGENVRKRVEQALRGKAKSAKKQLLTITDKALLNKPLAERTDHDKRYLYRIIGGLKCFKRYPNNVKRKLAAVTYFQYYSPNRVIVRQHQEAHALYFIITGNVTISHLVYDDVVEQYVSQDIGQMHPGELFGEVSLLHNIPRTATVTTDGHCEFLQLMKEDFKDVLQATIQAQWDEVLQAMSAFTYFDCLDNVARREGCIMAKMKTYSINETILGDGQGIPNFVYFVLKGQCQMIESLKIHVLKRAGKEFYSLYDPWEPEEESEEDFDKKYFAAYNLSKEPIHSLCNISEQEWAKRAFSKSLGNILKLPSIHGIDPRMSDFSRSKLRTHQSKKLSHFSNVVEVKESEEKGVEPPESVKEGDASEEKRVSYDVDPSQSVKEAEGSGEKRVSYDVTSPESRGASVDVEFIPPRRSTTFDDHNISKMYMSPSTEFQRKPSVRYSVKDPRELRTYFMQVCRFNPGSTFGFGENMRDRRIIALKPVSCMLLPKVWLLQRNTANIWTRIQHYLDKKIPKKDKLFKMWQEHRRWLDYRDILVEDVVARTHAINHTSVHDVPYSIRMEELLDI